MAPTSWKSKRAQIARRSQDLPPDAPEIQQLGRELQELRFEDRVARLLDEAPPLSAEVRDRIAALLRPYALGGGDLHAAG